MTILDQGLPSVSEKELMIINQSLIRVLSIFVKLTDEIFKMRKSEHTLKGFSQSLIKHLSIIIVNLSKHIVSVKKNDNILNGNCQRSVKTPTDPDRPRQTPADPDRPDRPRQTPTDPGRSVKVSHEYPVGCSVIAVACFHCTIFRVSDSERISG